MTMGLAAGVVLQQRGLGGLMLARLLIGVFNQFLDGKRFLLDVAFACEETHLADEPRDALDTLGERMIQRFTEFLVLVFLTQQLLMRGQRDKRVANLVRHAVGHGSDEAQGWRLRVPTGATAQPA